MAILLPGAMSRLSSNLEWENEESDPRSPRRVWTYFRCVEFGGLRFSSRAGMAGFRDKGGGESCGSQVQSR